MSYIDSVEVFGNVMMILRYYTEKTDEVCRGVMQS